MVLYRFLMREDAMYLKETRAPSGYEKSDQVLFVEVKDDEIFIDGKKVENNEFLFENKKIHVPTGIEYHGNMYVTLGLIALVIILHLINKKFEKVGVFPTFFSCGMMGIWKKVNMYIF